MVMETAGTKLFRVHCPNAQQVYLVGDFNRWAVPGVPMKQVETGVWEVTAQIPAGAQRFGYYVINWRWNLERSARGRERRGYEVTSGPWIGQSVAPASGQ